MVEGWGFCVVVEQRLGGGINWVSLTASGRPSESGCSMYALWRTRFRSSDKVERRKASSSCGWSVGRCVYSFI